MKKTFILNIFAFILAVIILSGCHFSVGSNKDLSTGLSSSYNGFSVKDVFLADTAGKHLSSNKIPINSTFFIIANGIGNYTLKNGKAYPGCEITINDKNGKLMGHLPDAMAEISKDGLEPSVAAALSANVTLSPPLVVGEPYHVAIRFFDKENEKNKITADVDVVLQ
jgi:hypothetical protein